MPKSANIGLSISHADSKVKSFGKEVFRKQSIKKLYSTKDGFMALLGRDKYNKTVRRRLGADQKFAVAVKELWNRAVSVGESSLADSVDDLAALDTRKAKVKLKDLGGITLETCVDYYIANAMSPAGIVSVETAMEIYYKIQQGKDLSQSSSDKSHTNYATYYKPFVNHFKDRELVSLTPKDAEKYFKKRGGGWGNTHWNSQRNYLSRFWRVLAKNDYCSADVDPFLKLPKKKKKGARTSTKVTDPKIVEQYFRFVEKECERYPAKYAELALMTLTFFCGIRVEEVSRCYWNELDKSAEPLKTNPDDWTSWEIIVWSDKEKTSQSKVNPVPENAQAWLTLCQKNCGTKFTREGWRRKMQKLRAKFRGEQDVNLHQNTARHSWTSYHIAKYNNEALTASRLGHGESVATLRSTYRAGMSPSKADDYFNIIPKVELKRRELEAAAKDQEAYEQAKAWSKGAEPIKDEHGEWHPVILEDAPELPDDF
jgi:hypothetical protein